MADTPSASGSGSGTPAPKAIGSLAKKQSDVTRQGAQKLKFVPTLPQRRKKEEAKPEPAPAAIPSSAQADGTRGRGRVRGGRGLDGAGGRGRGRGRGGPPEVVMTASGPFAMGPAMAGSAASRRSTPRSNFAPSIAPSTSSTSSLGAGLSQTAPPSLKKDVDLKGKGKEVAKQDEDEEVYSDPDEGVEIVDMERVREMDWMAPESLRKEKAAKKKVKKEQANDPDIPGADVDTANALNLSDSEEEEEPELEDVIEDFATQATSGDGSLREDRLYLFQFPSPFPTFLPNIKPSDSNEDVEMSDGTKKVSFGPDVKPPVEATPATSRTASTVPSETPKPDPLNGVIGRLEVYRSGTVKIRLGDDIVLDVNPATQPSFLQQAVYLDRNEKRLSVLGEVNKQFVASPDVDVLLQALEEADNQIVNDAMILEGEEKLIKM